MDFERVLRDLVFDFTERKVPYALIGGFALGALGVPRATMDLDFLVARDALPLVDEIMARRQYRLRYRSENVFPVRFRSCAHGTGRFPARLSRDLDGDAGASPGDERV